LSVPLSLELAYTSEYDVVSLAFGEKEERGRCIAGASAVVPRREIEGSLYAQLAVGCF